MVENWSDFTAGRVVQPDDWVLIKAPTYVGSYQIGGPMGLCFSLTHKPRWLHRQMMRLCFGWVWVDA
jgi:hypothetical protein